jgi:pectin methylesterase-like acyl-CoA thioesterase
MVISVASLGYAKDSQTVKGWVSNSKCGAKDASADGAACTEKCIKAGASPVVVTDADQKVLTVDNPESLKGHYGHHVAVTGKVDGDKIHIDNVAMAKE